MSKHDHPFAGVHSALVTPFDSEHKLDIRSLSELVVWQKTHGIHGVVVGGTTGESPTLSLEEKVQLVRVAKEHAGTMKVIAGAGSNCTKTAIAWQKAVEDAGACATLSVVPYYNKPPQSSLIEHFLSIDKQSSMPIILYNVPGRTGIDLSPNSIAIIASQAKNIIGIKDANTSIERLSELFRLLGHYRPDFLVLAGEDAAFWPYLSMGSHGVISVISQVAPNEMLALYQCIKNGDVVYGQKIARLMNSLLRLFEKHPNPLPIKTVMAAMGLIEKQWRPPLCPLDPKDEQELLAGCKDFSFLKMAAAESIQ